MVWTQTKEELWWLEYCLKACRTGSQVIANPPPPEGESDVDYICLIDEGVVNWFENRLRKEGWSIGGSKSTTKSSKFELLAFPSEQMYYRDEGTFHSWKKEHQTIITPDKYILDHENGGVKLNPETKNKEITEITNLILTCSEQYYKDFVLATYLAKHLNLKDKKSRVALFEAIVRNHFPVDPNLILKNERPQFIKGVTHDI